MRVESIHSAARDYASKREEYFECPRWEMLEYVRADAQEVKAQEWTAQDKAAGTDCTRFKSIKLVSRSLPESDDYLTVKTAFDIAIDLTVVRAGLINLSGRKSKKRLAMEEQIRSSTQPFQRRDSFHRRLSHSASFAGDNALYLSPLMTFSMTERTH